MGNGASSSGDRPPSPPLPLPFDKALRAWWKTKCGVVSKLEKALLTGTETRRALPPEIVQTIISDYSGVWNGYTKQRRAEFSGSNCDKCYLSFEVPSDLTNMVVKEISISVIAHDQGWSSYHQDYGTQNNSWTWGEVAVVPIGSNEKPTQRVEVYRNYHAVRDWRHHQRIFNSDHPLCHQLRPGHKLCLYLRAMFPGWVNYVRMASISVKFARPLVMEEQEVGAVPPPTTATAISSEHGTSGKEAAPKDGATNTTSSSISSGNDVTPKAAATTNTTVSLSK